jgi:C4-dicarboxylate-specific signal transduction histidine kinase
MLGLADGTPSNRDAFIGVVHPEDRSSVAQALDFNFNDEQTGTFEFRIDMPDGQIRWMSAHCHAHRDQRGKAIQLAGIFRDFTARRAAQIQSELQRRELAHLTRVAVLGELSGALAHELNQPLTAILANAQAVQKMLAQPNPDMPEIASAIEDIVQDDNRAGDVISRLRGLLKNGERKIERINLNELAETTVQLLHSELLDRRVRTNVDLHVDLPCVAGDPVELQQVIINLMMNAMEAMGETPATRRVVTIRTQSNGNALIEVSIEDCGAGISDAQQAHLFEPFFTTKDQGLGLGLSICSTIIRSHGGELSIDNTAKGGARASFTLPTIASAAPVPLA